MGGAMRRIRRPSHATVVAYVALFIAISGGTAVALSGSNNVFTDDVANDTQPASGGNPAGGLVAADLRPGSVGSSEVINNSLTGTDVKNLTGGDVIDNSLTGSDVDESSLTFECPAGFTLASRDVCFDATHSAANHVTARDTCEAAGTRLPTVAEAQLLQAAQPSNTSIWTTDFIEASATTPAAVVMIVTPGGLPLPSATSSSALYRCVTTPHG
jgi:hypothetical protein